MAETPFKVRHGTLDDVDGPARRHGDVSIVPARITLNGRWFQSSSELRDFIADYPAEIKAIVMPGEDAPWVLARLMRLFHIGQIPEAERQEKSYFFASFIAVIHSNELVGVPFQCSDYYGKSSITFSTDDPPPRELQEQVVSAFWGLLLKDPDDVADYEDSMFHSGASVWIRFGVENGKSFMEEESEHK